MKRVRQFRVELIVPDDASVQDCKEYILDAVRTWRDFGDPMWGLNPDSVTVTRINQ